MGLRVRRTGAILIAVPLVLAMAACGTPPWAESSASSTPRHSTARPTPTPTAGAGDLANGSLKRSLTAGDITLAVDYWSDLPLAQWTPVASKTLNVSATATLGTDSGQAVYLSSVTVTLTVHAGSKVVAAPAPLVDNSTVSPGYLVKSPYSYTQVFTIGALDPKATSVDLLISYKLLQQSTPTSTAYAEHAVSDRLTIPLAQG